MKVIPAIDIIEGKCVRLTKGDYNQKKIYNENPLEVALQFEDAGIVNQAGTDIAAVQRNDPAPPAVAH